ADPADAVHDRHVVPAARLLVGQQLRVLLARRVAADLGRVADADGVVRVVADDSAVLDVDARGAVPGRGGDERVVEPGLLRPWLDRGVVVGLLRAEAEVPLADGRGGVPGVLEQFRQRVAVERDRQRGDAGEDARPRRVPPGVLAGEQRVPGRGADGGG